MLSISASAKADEAAVDIKTQIQVMAEAYEDAGWTVQTPIEPHSADIDPETLELAYMDIDQADAGMRQKISPNI